MVYTGAGALAANGRGSEPSLIDPRLPVNWKGRGRAGGFTSHNPSYRRADPRVRAAYLQWLAGGRRNRYTSIGNVFLFFYGLERRLFADLGADLHLPEVEVILAEIERLRGIYGQERSFLKSAGELLDFVEGVRSLTTDVQPVPWTPDRPWSGVPASVRVGIGRYVAKSSPIPAEWALSYLRHHPQGQLRTPARRVAAEFDQLFAIRYGERFGPGIRTPRPAEHIQLMYRAASSGFHGGVHVTCDPIPDVTRDPSLIIKLNELARQCHEELDAYSRLIGRYPDRAGTPAAVGLLPDALLATHGRTTLDILRTWTSEVLADRPTAVVPLDDLVEQWSPGHPPKLTKATVSALAFTLANLGVGIEPDVRFGSSPPGPGTRAVLFPLPEGDRGKPTPRYRAVLSLVFLGALVAAADGAVNPIEHRFLTKRLEGITGLDTADRARLEAHLTWLGVRKPRLQDAQPRVKKMQPRDLPKVGTLLIELAAADGTVNYEEIAVLEKLFQLMGLDEAHLYGRAHTLDLADRGPISVGEKAPGARWEIPDSGGVSAPQSPVNLDPAKIRDRLAETDRVAHLLADIFVDDDPPPEIESGVNGSDPESAIEGLDGPHRQLLDALAARAEWDRGSAEELARSFGLPFLDSALDVINETALDHCGESVVEGDDPMVLNADAIKELI